MDEEVSGRRSESPGAGEPRTGRISMDELMGRTPPPPPHAAAAATPPPPPPHPFGGPPAPMPPLWNPALMTQYYGALAMASAAAQQQLASMEAAAAASFRRPTAFRQPPPPPPPPFQSPMMMMMGGGVERAAAGSGRGVGGGRGRGNTPIRLPTAPPPPPHRRSYFAAYMSRIDVDDGLKRQELIEGTLRINQRNYEEAYLDSPTGDDDADILIWGLKDRNRSLHGDTVIARLKPKQQWIVQQNLYRAHKESLEEGGSGEKKKKIVEKLDATELEKKAAEMTESVKAVDLAKETTAQSRRSTPSPPRVIFDLEEGVIYHERIPSLPHPNHHMHAADWRHYTRERMLLLGRKVYESDLRTKEGLTPAHRAAFERANLPLRPTRSPPVVAVAPPPPTTRARQPPTAAAQKRRARTLADYPADEQALIPDSCLQKTAEVVLIAEKRHSRAAVGSLKPMNDGNRNWALFSPTDSRVPRMMIPADELPPEFFSRPQDFAKFIFIARLAEWPETAQYARGKLYQSLGMAGEIEPETEGMLIQYQVDTREFSHDARACLPDTSNGWTIPQDEIEKRRDFRGELVFTIDPTTARDLDDALHVNALDDGSFEVGVHIADVSHFLEANTELDKWASNRATSVYLVHKVVPMLPRELCEELCSLNPGVDRLTFSVVFKMNAKGEVTDEWFGRSLIHSVAKLTYDHAQSLIDEETLEGEDGGLPTLHGGRGAAELGVAVGRLHALAVQLRRRRFDAGALALNQPKLCFTLDAATGLPNGCSVYEQRDSNRLVEEFMLLANMAVARRIHTAFPKTALLRRHPPPNRKVLREVLELTEKLGFRLDGLSAGGLHESLRRLHGSSAKATAITAVLTQLCMRPMRLAVYFCTGCLKDEGSFSHYALNVPFYTHFTSPIRRYADVMVHRLLAASLEEGDGQRLTAKETQAYAQRCNEKKYAAKGISEASGEMFFAVFVKECGPLVERAMVTNVMDHAFDVLLVRFGIIKRVYTDKLSLSGEPSFSEGPPGELRLCFRSADVLCRDRRLVVHVLTELDVTLTAAPDDQPLKFLATVEPPSEQDCDVDDSQDSG